MKRRSRVPIGMIGGACTLLYLVGLVLLVTAEFESFQDLSPNEWGDFLAGTLGPVALIWVVLSFLLQGRELQHSVDALNQQAEELRKSVEQQEKMVAVSREAMRIEEAKAKSDFERRERETAPEFRLSNEHVRGDGSLTKILTLTNIGGNATSIEIQAGGYGSFRRALLGTGESWGLQEIPALGFLGNPKAATVWCEDKNGKRYEFVLGLPG